MERRLALWLRRFSACFARFLAEGELATVELLERLVPGCSQFHHHGVARAGLCPRYHPGAHLRRRCCHRRLFHCLQAAQPAAANLCRGGVFPGVRADPGRIQKPAGRGGDPHLRGLCRRPADPGAGSGHGAGDPGRALGGVGHRAGLRRQRREVRADHRPAACDLSLYIADLAVVPGGRHPQHLEPLLGTGLRADPAQRRDDLLRAVPHPVLRSAGDGPGLGGTGRRPVAAAVPAAAPQKDRHARAAPPEPARYRGMARAQADAASHPRGVGKPDLADHQHHLRLVSGGRLGVVDVLRRPPDGAALRGAGRGAGHHPAADPGQDLRQQGPPRVFAHPRLGPAPVLLAGVALHLCPGNPVRAADGGPVPVRQVHRLRCRHDPARADRLLGRPARHHPGQGARPWLLCPAEHPYTGKDRHLHPGGHATAQPGVHRLPAACRAGPGDQCRRLPQCRPAVLEAAPAEPVRAAAGLDRLPAQVAGGRTADGRCAGGRHVVHARLGAGAHARAVPAPGRTDWRRRGDLFRLPLPVWFSSTGLRPQGAALMAGAGQASVLCFRRPGIALLPVVGARVWL
uniref:Integral membrane protein n=1 Tax=Parastrongyloides trichosuri TaxID=131310 RepID=A0A0N5A5U8_PARTI